MKTAAFGFFVMLVGGLLTVLPGCMPEEDERVTYEKLVTAFGQRDAGLISHEDRIRVIEEKLGLRKKVKAPAKEKAK